MASTIVRHPFILGQAIKTARKSRGLTQVGLAESVGSYPRAIIDLERGRSGGIDLVLRVLQVLELQLRVEPA
jgi:transcriptional regulator with XRE-family HTH domain